MEPPSEKKETLPCLGKCVTKMNSRLRLYLAVLLLLLTVFAVLGFFCHPAADDFEDAAASIKNGFWNCYRNRFLLWNGRYTDNLFAFATPLRWHSITAYQLVPVLLMTLSYFSIFYFLKLFLKSRVHLYTAV